MNGRFVLIVLAALTLIATGCKKDHTAGGTGTLDCTYLFMSDGKI